MKERRCDEYDDRQKKVKESQHRQMIGRSTKRQIRRQIYPGRCTDERTIDDTDKMTDKGKTSTRQTMTDRMTYRKKERQLDGLRTFSVFFSSKKFRLWD
jgi:hypothetical protein